MSPASNDKYNCLHLQLCSVPPVKVERMLMQHAHMPPAVIASTQCIMYAHLQPNQASMQYIRMPSALTGKYVNRAQHTHMHPATSKKHNLPCCNSSVCFMLLWKACRCNSGWMYTQWLNSCGCRQLCTCQCWLGTCRGVFPRWSCALKCTYCETDLSLMYYVCKSCSADVAEIWLSLLFLQQWELQINWRLFVQITGLTFVQFTFILWHEQIRGSIKLQYSCGLPSRISANTGRHMHVHW